MRGSSSAMTRRTLTRRTMFDIGRTRRVLAKGIEQAFKDAGIEVRSDPSKLWPAQGRWRSDVRMDVMRWEGHIEEFRFEKWQVVCIHSWDKMTDCVKGCTIWRDGFAYEVGAVEPGQSKSERFFYEGKQ